jgi:microcystin-dependent protein
MDPFLGEIKLTGFNFAPFGWAACQGQILSIQQFTALFSLLGTTYGGNGTSNFGLPNLQSRSICGQDPANNVIGEMDGTESVTILLTEYPAHTHTVNVFNTFGAAGQPTNVHYLAATKANAPSPPPPPPPPPPTAGPNLYGGVSGGVSGITPLIPAVLAPYNGGSQPHENRQPYLGMMYSICMQGIFPARN